MEGMACGLSLEGWRKGGRWRWDIANKEHSKSKEQIQRDRHCTPNKAFCLIRNHMGTEKKLWPKIVLHPGLIGYEPPLKSFMA